MSWKCSHCERKNGDNVQECWNCGHLSDIPAGFALEWTATGASGKYPGKVETLMGGMAVPQKRTAKGWTYGYVGLGAILLVQGLFVFMNHRELGSTYMLNCVTVLLVATLAVSGLLAILVYNGGRDAIAMIQSMRPSTKDMSNGELQGVLLETGTNATVLLGLSIASQILYYMMFFNSSTVR